MCRHITATADATVFQYMHTLYATARMSQQHHCTLGGCADALRHCGCMYCDGGAPTIAPRCCSMHKHVTTLCVYPGMATAGLVRYWQPCGGALPVVAVPVVAHAVCGRAPPLPAGAACRDVRGRGASAATSLRCSPCAQWRCWRRVLLLLAPVYRHGTSTSSCLVVLARPPTHLHPERLDTMRGAREGRRPVVASVAGRQVGSLFCLAPSNFADTYLSDH